MQKDTAYLNKLIKKKDHERLMQYHLQNIRNIKPITKPQEGMDVNLNNRKKQYQNEIRFTQIQRQNRILLQKIQSIMNKSKRGTFYQDRTNKSLNSTFRRRQNYDIQIQNARFLKRLQQKKPNYETQRFNKQWIKQKNVMKIMSNYPFMIAQRPNKKRNSMSQMDKKSTNIEPIQLVRVRVINGISFLVTVSLSAKMLRISGDCRQRKEIKVIEIQRNQAIEFIEEQCHGKIEEVFNHLRYDKQQSILYLVGNQVQLDQLIAKQKQVYGKTKYNNQQSKVKQDINRNHQSLTKEQNTGSKQIDNQYKQDGDMKENKKNNEEIPQNHEQNNTQKQKQQQQMNLVLQKLVQQSLKQPANQQA